MEQQIHREKQQLQAQVGFPQAACSFPLPWTPLLGQAAGPVTGQLGAARGYWEWVLSYP